MFVDFYTTTTYLITSSFILIKTTHNINLYKQGADHAKFQGGITGRYQRLAKKEAAANGQQLNCLSVILNPTLIDTRPSGSVSMESNTASAGSKIGNNGLSLQLRYLKKGIDGASPESRESSATGGVLPLADYIVLSKS